MNKTGRKETKRIAIFGGSFDPPHSAHVMVASYLLTNFDFDSVWVIPCFSHPFNKRLADFEHRIRMCRMAFSCFKRGMVKVLDIERESGGVSYTVETLKLLKLRHPACSFSLVLGSDIMKETEKWKDFNEIKKMVEIIYLNRTGFTSNNLNDSAILFPNISSSVIRDKLQHGDVIENLVPIKVAAYIRKNRLYLTG